MQATSRMPIHRCFRRKATDRACRIFGAFCRTGIELLLSRENFSLFLLGPFPSVFLTNSSSWRLAKSLEETTDNRRGCEPPVILRRQRKPRRGDRDISKLLLNKLHILSPFQGLLLSGYPVPGVHTPVCSLSHLRCFSPDSNKIECFVRQWKSLHVGKQIPTARRSDSHSKEKQFPQQGKANPTARKSNFHSKEERFPLQGKAVPTARKSNSHSKERRFPQQGKTVPSCGKS